MQQQITSLGFDNVKIPECIKHLVFYIRRMVECVPTWNRNEIYCEAIKRTLEMIRVGDGYQSHFEMKYDKTFKEYLIFQKGITR